MINGVPLIWITGRNLALLIRVHLLETIQYTDGLAHDCSNSTANALELPKSGTKSSIYGMLTGEEFKYHNCFGSDIGSILYSGFEINFCVWKKNKILRLLF